ncbi:MAG: 3'-phosphoesterase [Candidatus Bathyarchaeota archaeon]|nr:3'-phosphoesterase [Candidatus Bathyarchaeota archaeon]
MRRFVVKAHWASRLHYDLRLEMEGVAKSWAVRKEPLLEPRMRRLAIQVEDHTIEDMDHEDLTKERTLRSGRVETWDQGTYELLGRDENKLLLRFNGTRLNGIYSLIKVKRWKGNNWLLTKRTAK